MSELLTEYTHVVADLKRWSYFDVPGCLKRLPWSVSECYSRILPQWFKGSFLTRHAVVQLALYACQPFYNVPDGTIYDRYIRKDGSEADRHPPCPHLPALIEALATAFLDYEALCEYLYPWPAFEARRDQHIAFLEGIQSLLTALRRRGFAPEDPALRRKRTVHSIIQQTINVILSITEQDYRHAGVPTPEPGHPCTQLSKWMLLNDMVKAFRQYVPAPWPQAATYRAVAAIINQMGIYNAEGQPWTPAAVKTLLARGPDPRLRLRIIVERPYVDRHRNMEQE